MVSTLKCELFKLNSKCKNASWLMDPYNEK